VRCYWHNALMVNAFFWTKAHVRRARARDRRSGGSTARNFSAPPRLVYGASTLVLAFRHASVPDIVDSGAAGRTDSVNALAVPAGACA
jgi:hypothetical protein